MSHQKMTFRRLLQILFSRPHNYRQARLRRRLWIAVIMRLIVLLVLILLVVLIVTGVKSCARHRKNKSAEKTSKEQTEPKSGDASIAFTGGIVLDDKLMESCRDDSGVYDFSPAFEYVKKQYKKADIMVCEVEGNIADVENKVSGLPDVLPGTLKEAGIDLQMIATNHMYDAGGDGLKSTLLTYNDDEIKYNGLRNSAEDKRYIIMKSGAVKVGLCDYTYGTPGAFAKKSVSDDDAALINMFKETDPVDFYPEVENQIAAMKDDGADLIVYMLHWGAENEFEPSDDQKAIAQELCNRGVDIVIGNHPLVEQPSEVLTSEDGKHKMFCVYSIGNALSNLRKGDEIDTAHNEDGSIITFDLHKSEKGKVTITDVKLTPTWVCRVRKADTVKDDENGEEGDEESEEKKDEDAIVVDQDGNVVEKEDENTLYDYAILPLTNLNKLEKVTGLKGITEDAKASHERTLKILGDGVKQAKKELVKK